MKKPSAHSSLLKRLLIVALIFVMNSCSRAELPAEELIDIVFEIVPNDLIVNPMHGFHEIGDNYWHGLGNPPMDYRDLDPSLNYHLWTPEKGAAEPTFWAIGESKNEGCNQRTSAILRTRHVKLAFLNSLPWGRQPIWSETQIRGIVFPDSIGRSHGQFIYHEHSKEEIKNNYFHIVFTPSNEFVDSLELMDLSYTRLESQAFHHLSTLPNLRRLTLPRDGNYLSHPEFKLNPNLEELVVWNSRLSKDCLRKISSLENLKKLVLNGCSIDFYVDGWDGTLPKFFAKERVDLPDPIEQLRHNLEHLTLINCNQSLTQFFGSKKFEQLKTVTLDCMARGSLTHVREKVTFLVPEENVKVFLNSAYNMYISTTHENIRGIRIRWRDSEEPE